MRHGGPPISEQQGPGPGQPAIALEVLREVARRFSCCAPLYAAEASARAGWWS